MYPSFQHPQYTRPQPPGPPPISIPQQSIQHQSYPPSDMSLSSIQQPDTASTGGAASSPPQTNDRDREEEEAMYALPGPGPVSRIFDGKAWALKIVQQPLRARMCGFGDKDRRPISPPPCIKLIIIDPETGAEVDYSKYENLSRFVLMVDLSNVESSEEKNLVKHTSTSPSISSVTTTSYPPTITSNPSGQPRLQSYNISNVQAFATPPYMASQNTTSHPPAPYQTNGTPHQPYFSNGTSPYARPAPPYADSRYPQYQSPYAQAPQVPAAPQSDPRMMADQQRTISTGMVTRNLIGSLSGSAFKLVDLDGETGLWFVFQDLSIRTEGWFRLKFTFFDLMGQIQPDNATLASLSQLAPMLACVYSQPFKVYSAKRFPGVIESTSLSRKFAAQGIKIPIRKDGNKSGKRGRDGQASDSDELGEEEVE